MNIKGTLKVDVVTPERAVVSVQSPLCVLPTKQGQVEILPGHIPLLAALDAGELVVEVEGATRSFYVEGGFAEVANDVVSVITDMAYGAEDFDLERARANLKEAEEELHSLERRAATEKIEMTVLEEHQEELRRARLRLAFGEDHPGSKK